MPDKVIENLITKLTFEWDKDTIDKFDKAIDQVEKSLLTIVAAATTVATGIFLFTKKVAESNDEIGKFAKIIGVDIAALQEFGYVAELNGGSIDSMNSSLANVSKLASEAARGIGAGAEVFGIMGISVTDVAGKVKAADALMLDIADSIAKLGSQAEKLEFAQKLGIGEDLILSLQQGSEAIKQQRKEAQELGFAIDRDAATAAADFNDELLRARKIVLGVSNAIGTRLMKQITPMIKIFVEWFKINKAIIQQNLTKFLDNMVTTIRGVFGVVSRLWVMVDKLAQGIGGWENAAISLTAVLLALNATALILPALVLAGGVAILLLIEDIQKYAEGGESALGELGKEFGLIELALRGVIFLANKFQEGLKFTMEFDTSDFESLLLGVELLFADFLDAIASGFTATINGAIDLLNKIPGIDIGNVESSFSAADIITQSLGSDATPVSAGSTSNSRSTTTTNNNTFTVNVQEGTKENVEAAFDSMLQKTFGSAKKNLSSNVEN